MIVDKDTKVSQILKEKPESIEAISLINKNFEKLKNPFLRKMLAPRVDIKAAAKVGNCSVNDILKSLEKLGFEVAFENENDIKLENNTTTEIYMEKTNIIDLDVRPILDSGVDPFNVIMDTLKNLNDGDTLKVINTFEPIPLLNILKSKGYEYNTERPEDGVVHTFLRKIGEDKSKENSTLDVDAPELSFEDLERKFENKLVEIDVRDLEMPMPMVSILEAIETLEDGQALYVHHKRLPQYLLPELKERGFEYKTQEIDADNMKLIIYRK
jgi:uncharacterized protein (DUF2249 family)